MDLSVVSGISKIEFLENTMPSAKNATHVTDFYLNPDEANDQIINAYGENCCNFLYFMLKHS